MTFGQSIQYVLGNLTNFTGRAGRSEFWWWFLFVIIVEMAANVIDSVIGTNSNALFFGWGIVTIIVGIVLFLANISVGCRRLHDTGRSGWWQLLALIPCVGTIILIIWWASPSTPGSNAYGEIAASA